MDLKKNIAVDVEAMDLDNFFKSENPTVRNIIYKITHSANLTVQQELTKSLAAQLSESTTPYDKEVVLRLLGFVYLFNSSKFPIKKTLGRTLSLIEDDNLLTKSLSESIELILKFIELQKDVNKTLILKNSFVSGMNTSWDKNFAVRAMLNKLNSIFNYVFVFLQEIVDFLWERKETYITTKQKQEYIYNASKFILTVLQKCEIGSIKTEDRLKLITCCYDIIIHPHINCDIKSNCAYIIVILFTALPESIRDECDIKEHPYFEFLKFGKRHSDVLEKVGIKDIEDPAVFQTFKVYIYLGIVNVTSWIALCDSAIDEDTVFTTIFFELIETIKRARGDPVRIIGVTKTLAYLSPYIQHLPTEMVDVCFKESLNYVFLYLDDKIELVRNNTKIVLCNLVKLGVKHRAQGDAELLKIILNWLKGLQDSIFYTALIAFGSVASCSFLLENIPDIPNQLLSDLIHPSKAYNICACYENLMELHLKESPLETEWLECWVNDVAIQLRKSETPLTQYFQRLFVSAFKIEPIALKILTKNRYFNNDAEISSFLACIYHIRKKGLRLSVSDFCDHQLSSSGSWHNLLDYDTLDILMTHQNSEIRISVLAIIIDTHKSSEVFTKWEVEFLLSYFRYNINLSNASVRQQFISYAKKAMQRIKNSYASVCKNVEDLISKHGPDVLLNESQAKKQYTSSMYTNFWATFFKTVLFVGLDSDCNYSRKSTCLELLHAAMEFFTVEDYFRYWTCEQFNNLKRILQYDTYEQNKEFALHILSKCPIASLNFHRKDVVTMYVNKCFLLALSVKPAHTIAASYLLKAVLRSPHLPQVIMERLHKSVHQFDSINKEDYKKDPIYLLLILLICELRTCVLTGQQNLQKAAATRPIHGILFFMRHLLRDINLNEKVDDPYWQLLIKDIMCCCYLLGEVIDPIICNQSPEGYIPDDSDFVTFETDETAKAQMITVYGWRAAKEISLLLGELALKAPFTDDKNVPGLMNAEQLKSMGDYFFNLLLNTKHRGAFEQASLGFSNLCLKLWTLPTNVNKLPIDWLNKILSSLLGADDSLVDTCATRRSAGVPFMVQTILMTEPNSGGNGHFHSCMNTLLQITSDPAKPEEQQIHCMNILRALYRHNHFGELIIPYCSRGVMISIEGYGNSSWGIRNSATLLFSALIVRMFGVQRIRDTETVSTKNKIRTEVFFTKYPELYEFLLEKLKEGVENVHSPSLFPVLLVLSRLYNGSESENTTQMDSFIPLIQLCLSNPTYRIRDLAVKSIVNLTSITQVHNLILRSFVYLSNVKITNNHCHGLLVQLQYLLQSRVNDLPILNIDEILDKTAWILICCGRQISHATSTLYVEVLLRLTKYCASSFDFCHYCTFIARIRSIILWQREKNVPSKIVSTATKKFERHMFTLKLYIIINMIKCGTICNNIGNLREAYLYPYRDLKMDRELQELCQHYVNYLKFNTAKYRDYSLYNEENWEHIDLINKFIKPLKPIFKAILYEILQRVLKNLLLTQTVRSGFNLDTIIFHNLPEKSDRYDLLEIKRYILAYGIYRCKTSNEQMTYVWLTWLSDFLLELSDREIRQLNLSDLTDLIFQFSSASVNSSYRLGVANLLLNNKRLFYDKVCIVKWSYRCMFWEAVFVLVEDDDEDVRNVICCICRYDLTAAKEEYMFVPKSRVLTSELAREILFCQMIKVLPKRCSVNILLSFILRTREVNSKHLSEVFEEGASNTYAEVYPVALVVTDVLCKMLWELENTLCFQDKSIFMEKQTLIIVTTLYDQFKQDVVPSLTAAMSTVACSILLDLKLSLEEGNITTENFRTEFKIIFLRARKSGLLSISEITRLKVFFCKLFINMLDSIKGCM